MTEGWFDFKIVLSKMNNIQENIMMRTNDDVKAVTIGAGIGWSMAKDDADGYTSAPITNNKKTAVVAFVLSWSAVLIESCPAISS